MHYTKRTGEPGLSVTAHFWVARDASPLPASHGAGARARVGESPVKTVCSFNSIGPLIDRNLDLFLRALTQQMTRKNLLSPWRMKLVSGRSASWREKHALVELLEEETLDNAESQSKRSGNCLDVSLLEKLRYKALNTSKSTFGKEEKVD